MKIWIALAALALALAGCSGGGSVPLGNNTNFSGDTTYKMPNRFPPWRTIARPVASIW